MVVFEGFRVVFELFEILELFEYLVANYSIFEVKLFVLESETLDVLISKVKGNIFTKESEILQYYEYQFVTYKLASKGFKA